MANLLINLASRLYTPSIKQDYSIDSARAFDRVCKDLGWMSYPRFYENFKTYFPYYEFYEGSGQKDEVEEIKENVNGVLTAVNSYKKIIENHTKICIDRESDFAVGQEFPVTYAATEGKDVSMANAFIDDVLIRSKFYNETNKAWRNCDIGARVAVRLYAKPGGEYKLFYHDVLSFDYEKNSKGEIVNFVTAASFPKKSEVAYANDVEVVMSHMYIDEMGNAVYEAITADGNGDNIQYTTEPYILVSGGQPVKELPVQLITNNDLEGVDGYSDIETVKEQQTLINQLKSDTAFALKYGMFEPWKAVNVVPQVDEKGQPLKQRNEPNAILYFQSDGDSASMEPMSKAFTWNVVYEKEVKDAKEYIYNSFGIPQRVDQGRAESGISQRLMYTDLINRCDRKIASWYSAFEHLFRLALQFAVNDGIVKLPSGLKVEDVNVDIQKNYNIIEDEQAEKEFKMKECELGLRSTESYLTECRGVEDVDDEMGKIDSMMKRRNNYVSDLTTEQ